MKIVGLLTGKGESNRIVHCLRAMAEIVDEIVYLDDNSPDDTLELAKGITSDCRIVRIINRAPGAYDESYNRNLLLRAGREIGGDRFLVINADEAFGADASATVRASIEQLKLGESLSSPWLHLWRSAKSYRTDPGSLVDDWQAVAFCDDGSSWYSNKQIGSVRVPVNGNVTKLAVGVAFLHFSHVYWPNAVIKQAWYQYLERVNGKSVDKINDDYLPLLDETGLKVADVKPEWFHPFFNESDFQVPYLWRIDEMRQMSANKENQFSGLIGIAQALSTTLESG